MKAGFWPDTFSTDWNANEPTTGVVDFPNCMSKLLGYGMSVERGDRARDRQCRRASFHVFRDRGTLNVGAPADVAVLELRDGDLRIRRQLSRTRSPGRQRLFPSATVLAGKRVARA